jgi:D-methionine transport system substrate-binding protein
VELEAPQLVRALDDVEVAQVSFTCLLASGGAPNTALITDGAKNPHYAIQFVARPQEANDPRLVKFVSIFQSPDEKVYILNCRTALEHAPATSRRSFMRAPEEW